MTICSIARPSGDSNDPGASVTRPGYHGSSQLPHFALSSFFLSFFLLCQLVGASIASETRLLSSVDLSRTRCAVRLSHHNPFYMLSLFLWKAIGLQKDVVNFFKSQAFSFRKPKVDHGHEGEVLVLVVSRWAPGTLNKDKTYECHENQVSFPSDIVNQSWRDLDNHKNLDQISTIFWTARILSWG